MAEVIRMDQVTKVYRAGSLAVAALRGMSFTIDEGEYVSVMGPSGSGKSTLDEHPGLPRRAKRRPLLAGW